MNFDPLIAWNRKITTARIRVNGTKYKLPNGHPGGKSSIEHAFATFDAEPLLETYHLDHPALPKGPCSPDTSPPFSSPFTFEKDGFYKTLKRRVRTWKRENKIKNFYAPTAYLVVWVLHVLTILTTGFLCVYYRSLHEYGRSYLCGFLCSVLRALMLFREAHAAAHYTVSSNPSLNWMINQISWAIISVLCADNLTASHVENHHLYTSVQHLDDADFPGIRVSKKEKWRIWNRYQYYYVTFIYATVLIFVPLRDLTNILMKTRFDGRRLINSLIIIFFATFYYGPCLYFKDLALFLCCVSPCSMILAFCFGVNHQVEKTLNATEQYDLAKAIEERVKVVDFGLYQASITPNYSENCWLTNQLTGGLNHHRTHHILPKIHYSYYPAITKIVEATLEEFGLKCVTYGSFFAAVKDHYALIKLMSSPDV